MENHALDIIDMLYNMIAEAWGVPLGNDKCIVERDKALNLLDDLKATLPMELNARDEFVANAKQEADNIRRGAEDKATQMIDEQNVYKEARRRSDEIVQTAEAKSRELLRAANSYLDDALRQTEEAVAESLEKVRAARAQFRAAAAPERPEGTADVTLQDVEDSEFING